MKLNQDKRISCIYWYSYDSQCSSFFCMNLHFTRYHFSAAWSTLLTFLVVMDICRCCIISSFVWQYLHSPFLYNFSPFFLSILYGCCTTVFFLVLIMRRTLFHASLFFCVTYFFLLLRFYLYLRFEEIWSWCVLV